ncbi:MAG: hypothetical protein WC876_05050 [Candidatus Thermoplasmatota archaeon]|jgi:hypothetical protein
MRALVAFLAVVAVAATASAQSAPGCTQANPCVVTVDVDAAGIADLSETLFTSGDWMVLSVYNNDEQAHTVRLAGHPVDVTVAAGDLVDTQPFKLGAAGTYALSDAPSGDSADLLVEAEESFSSDSGTSGGGNGIPGPTPALLVAAVAALAWGLRRK